MTDVAAKRPTTEANASELTLLERKGGAARLILDRPPLNILTIAMMREVDDLVAELASDDTVKVLSLTGAGRAFCAGVDVADHTEEKVEEMLRIFHGLIVRILELPFPVIAEVNGAALGGGCELALACDVVLAREGAKIGQPEIRLGVFPPAAAVLLPLLIGRQRALDLILSGRILRAAEAAQMGLVTQVISGDFRPAAEEYAASMASLSGPVLRLAKRVLLGGATETLNKGLERAEHAYLQDLMALEDPREGLAAFLEGRPPVWTEA